jgi:peroxiredoxin
LADKLRRHVATLANVVDIDVGIAERLRSLLLKVVPGPRPPSKASSVATPSDPPGETDPEFHAVSVWRYFCTARALRSLGILTWRLEQMAMTHPVRKGREGLQVGKIAPDFTLPTGAGQDVSLRDFAGRKVLLVFTQTGCGPCHGIVPALSRLHDRGEYLVLVVNNGERDDARQWADETGARFLVLGQEKWVVSKKYEVYATPFAFVIDERGVITSKGAAGTAQFLGYVLDGVGNRGNKAHEEPESDSAVEHAPEGGTTSAKELSNA